MDPVSPPPGDDFDSELARSDDDRPGSATGSPRGPSRRRRIMVLATSGAIVVAIVISAGLLLLRSPAGRVYFSSDPYDQAGRGCQFGTPITSTTSARPFYMIAFFSDTLDPGESYSLAITRDGAAYRDSGEMAADKGFQCYVEQDALGPLDPGVYRFTFTHAGKVEAEGSLTVR